MEQFSGNHWQMVVTTPWSEGSVTVFTWCCSRVCDPHTHGIHITSRILTSSRKFKVSSNTRVQYQQNQLQQQWQRQTTSPPLHTSIRRTHLAPMFLGPTRVCTPTPHGISIGSSVLHSSRDNRPLWQHQPIGAQYLMIDSSFAYQPRPPTQCWAYLNLILEKTFLTLSSHYSASGRTRPRRVQ